MVIGWQAALRGRWWWVVALAALGASVGWAAPLWAAGTAQVVSSAEVVVTGRITEDGDSALTMNQYVNERMSTYILVASSEIVRADAAVRAETGPEAFSESAVTVSNPADTTALVIEVGADDPESARSHSQAFADALIDRIELLEQNRDGRAVVVTVESAPSLPAAVDPPPVALTVPLGALIGALLGILGAVARGEARGRRPDGVALELDDFWSTYDEPPYDRPRYLGPPPPGPHDQATPDDRPFSVGGVGPIDTDTATTAAPTVPSFGDTPTIRYRQARERRY